MIERIKTLIAYLGLSTRAFAIKCGLRQNTLSNQLNGMRELSLSTVAAILDAYPEVSAEWLMRGDGQMLIQPNDSSVEVIRINKLVDTITTLQDTINSRNDTIASMGNRIIQLENQLGK